MVKLVSTLADLLVLAEAVLLAQGLCGVSHKYTEGGLEQSRCDIQRSPDVCRTGVVVCRTALIASPGKLEKLAIVAIGRNPYTPSPPPWEGPPQLFVR